MSNNFRIKPEIGRYEVLHTRRQIKRLGRMMMTLSEFAFDTETSCLRALADNDEFFVVGISISWGKYNNYYIPVNHMREEDYGANADTEDILEFLKPAFENPNVRVIGHNIKFDAHCMMRLGIEVNLNDCFDTMLATWLCDENRLNGLKEDSAYRLHVKQGTYDETVATVPNEVKKSFGLKAANKAPMQLVLIEDTELYAVEDAFYTWELYLGYLQELEDEQMHLIYKKMLIPFIKVLFDMEETGVTIDKEVLEQMSIDINKDLDDLRYNLFEMTGVEFNPGSDQQLAELLFGWVKQDKVNKKTGKMTIAKPNWHIIENSFKFKIISYTDGGQPQSNNDVLWQLSNTEYVEKNKRKGVEVCKLLLNYKKLEKLRSSFVDGMMKNIYPDGKVHPSFRQIGADSGRISCAEPNLQQLPKAEDEDKYKIRKLFIGSIDEITEKRMKITAHDFSNLEVRVAAHFSQDPLLFKMFANNEDVHGSTAVNMFELPCTHAEVKKMYPLLRQAAKILNFLLLYGGSAKALYESLRTDHYAPIDLGAKEYLEKYKCKNGVEVAQVYIDKYFSSYAGVAEFIRRQKKFAHKNGYVLTVMGRKRRLPDINSSDYGTVGYNERLSVNAPVQGSAADITSSAQTLISKDQRLKELRWRMLIQVHDEIVGECPEENEEEACLIVKQYMDNPFGERQLNVPMVAEYGTGWSYYEAK